MTEQKEKTAEEFEREYGLLTPKQKSSIDELAEAGPNDSMQDIAHRAGVSDSYLYYVENEYGELLEYRKTAMRYASDGSGEQYVGVRFTEDEAFKAIRILPAELSQVVYQAVKK